jgi:hypothetical protein
MPRPLILSHLGQFYFQDGTYFDGPHVDDTDVEVPHLTDTVLSYKLPEGDLFHVKVVFTSHCWTRSFQDGRDDDRFVVYDHNKQRVFCQIRYGASIGLIRMLQGLANHMIYNASDRNYGAYNATVKANDGQYYTAFFTLKRERGSLNGQRYRFVMRVESAYFTAQIGRNRRVTLAGVFAKIDRK